METTIKKHKLAPYPKYKDSGVEWLGEIPEHWEILSLGNLSELKSDKNHPEYEVLSVYRDYGVIPKSSRDDNHNATSLDTSNYKAVEIGDLVVNKMKAWQGSMGVSQFKGIVSPAYITCRITSPKIDSRFLHLLLRSYNYIGEYNRISYGVRVGQWDMHFEDFKKVPVIIPKLEEQRRIATYTDEKTSKIDQAIQQKEQLIQLLQERKQIIIQNAVTRGLDPEVQLKDSGVEWIGEVPEHWEVKKIRYLGSTQNGISAGAEYFGSGFPFVSYSDVYKNRSLPFSVKGLAKSTKEDRTKFSVLEGDIFFTRTSETAEEIGFSSTCLNTIENATFAGFLIRFRPSANRLHKLFSKYYFASSIHRAYFVKEMNLVTRASLSQELLKELPVLLPPLEEQEQIAQHIQSQSQKIDQAITYQRQQIERLQEYKQVLVNELVTGKVRV